MGIWPVFKYHAFIPANCNIIALKNGVDDLFHKRRRGKKPPKYSLGKIQTKWTTVCCVHLVYPDSKSL
jgi:hypothetical protein